MNIANRQSMANGVAERWLQQYPDANKPNVIQLKNFGNPADVYEKLVALGSTPDPDAVDEAIGNASWTIVPPCCECDESAEQIVCFSTYEHSVFVCSDCLVKAGQLF
jgi:hypothetical protein